MQLTRSSALAAPADVVWRHATSIPGINAEMAPWMSMTVPRELRNLTLDDPSVIVGAELFVSTVRLLRLLPVDRMRVTLVELERGRRFVEQSPMRSMRMWRHERSVEPEGTGCRVTDTLTFEPRVPFPAAVLRMFFAHRHRRLRARFGAA